MTHGMQYFILAAVYDSSNQSYINARPIHLSINMYESS